MGQYVPSRQWTCVLILSLLGIMLLLPGNVDQAPVSGGGEPLHVYELPSGLKPKHLDIVDENSFILNGTMSLHDAHVKGYPHRGAWVFVSDSEGKILFLKRAANMRTCPGSWGAAGEHHKPGESPEENSIRCIQEELGPKIVKHIRISQNLTEHAVWYYRLYEDGRQDKQATAIWMFVLDKPHRDLPFQFDNEVSDTKWIGLDDTVRWAREKPRDFCHETIRTLLSFCLVHLRKQLRIHLPDVYN